MAPRPEYLAAGRVGRPHGLDGSFYVTGARPRLLESGASVSVDGLERRITRRAGLPLRPIVRLQGIEDRSAAQAMRGRELRVATANVPDLGPDEWWAQELEGCAVYDGQQPVGRVERMLELPSCEVLEVLTEPAGRLLLVPMVREAIRDVRVQERRIDVDLAFLGETWN